MMLLYCMWLSMVAVTRSSDIAMPPFAVDPPKRFDFAGSMPADLGVPPVPFIPAKPRTCQRKTLGETCKSDGDCGSAFAQCAASVCTCRDGFEAWENGLCAPKAYRCPNGEPLLKNGSPVRCHRVLSAIVPLRRKRMVVMSEFNDSCPDTYFCLVHNNNHYESSSGHCCPSPKVVCPVGEALNASCSPLPIISAAQFAPNMEKRCPHETHYCQSIMFYYSSQSIGKDACCPKSCSDQDIYYEGKCYARGQLVGETCTIQQQCEDNQGTCVSGTCQCKKGYMSVGAGFCQGPLYCAGVDVNHMPLEPLVTAVGDIMRCNASTECPSSAYCTGSDQTCCPLPEPTCPLQQPNGKCDPNNFSDEQCGPNEFCYRYYYAAETMSTDGGVCCDRGMLVLPGPVMVQASPDFA